MLSRYAASRLARTLRITAGSQARRPGLAPTRPLIRAAFRPALVRSEISARSRWVTAPSTWSENMPCGVLVSMRSRKLRKCVPAAANCSMTARRWLTERARRSSLTTTRVSLAWTELGRRAGIGRSQSAQEECSSNISAQPAARSSSN